MDKYKQVKSHSGYINVLFTTVKIDAPATVNFYPDDFSLDQSTSNVAEVYYKLSMDASVSIEIFNNNNEKVKTIIKDHQEQKGINYFNWDGYDNNNDPYYYNFSAPFMYEITATSSTGKVTVVQGKFDENTSQTG